MFSSLFPLCMIHKINTVTLTPPYTPNTMLIVTMCVCLCMCVSMNIKEKIRHAFLTSVCVCVYVSLGACQYIDYGKGRLGSFLTSKLICHLKGAVSSELSLKTTWHQAENRGLLGDGENLKPPVSTAWSQSNTYWCGTNSIHSNLNFY